MAKSNNDAGQAFLTVLDYLKETALDNQVPASLSEKARQAHYAIVEYTTEFKSQFEKEAA